MKKITYLIIFLSLIIFPVLATEPAPGIDPVAEGETNYELGAFVVEKSNAPIIIDATIMPTYEVSYENSDMTIRIAVDNSDRKCRKFIVVSDNLAIQYNCDGRVFGVTLPDMAYIEDGIPSSKINLDRSEYHRQKVLTQQVNSEIEQIRLISVYFPKLVKDYDRMFAVK